MKRLSAVCMLGLVIVFLCPAQTQRGNASYDTTKAGFTISHSSLSFNTHVRVTNLVNNRSVNAIVNGRIPISPDRIADISWEAGDALGMSQTGMTLVEIAEIPSGNTQSAAPPVPSPPPAPPPVVAVAPAPPQTAAPAAPPVTQVLPIQTVTDVQYIPVPGAAQSNCCSPLLWVILLLLVLVVLLLTIILILILRRLLLWPWHYKVWYRRHLLYARKHRR